MFGARRMSPERLRLAYRYAVEQCLVVFFGLDVREAEARVAGWWRRMAAGSGLRTGLFLHGEAIDTAADLARCDEVPLNEDNEGRYRAVLEEASARTMQGAGLRDEVAENVLPDKAGIAVASPERDSLAMFAEG